MFFLFFFLNWWTFTPFFADEFLLEVSCHVMETLFSHLHATIYDKRGNFIGVFQVKICKILLGEIY